MAHSGPVRSVCGWRRYPERVAGVVLAAVFLPGRAASDNTMTSSPRGDRSAAGYTVTLPRLSFAKSGARVFLPQQMRRLTSTATLLLLRPRIPRQRPGSGDAEASDRRAAPLRRDRGADHHLAGDVDKTCVDQHPFAPSLAATVLNARLIVLRRRPHGAERRAGSRDFRGRGDEREDGAAAAVANRA